jgi:transcriptional regulator GlxA family with amidase domain
MVSICTGAFALASAGVLDGRPATTHWRAVEDLRRSFPLVDVKPPQLFIDDGDVLTSAGVMAGLDLCLHIIRRDRGAAAANERGRALVAPPRRIGNQSAYTPRLAPATDVDVISQLCQWMLENLSIGHRIDGLAQRSLMSRRTFLRRFTEATGVPPMQWLTLARVDRARELLESTTWTVDRIASETGLGIGAGIRATFHAHVGMPPSLYRAQFAEAEPQPE